MEQNNIPTVLKEYTNSPAEMIREALMSQQGIDLDKLGKLLEIQQKYEENQARKQFAKDFSDAQSKILAVVKTATNPQTRSKYAVLENVIETVRPICAEYGFSVTFNEGELTDKENVRILAEIMHKNGHVKQFHMDVPLDGVGIKGNANMTKIHGKASSVSYGRRYLMCMIWNIPTTDVDGNLPKSELISEDEKNAILDNLLALEADVDKFLQYMGIEKLEDMQKSDLKKAYVAIEEKKKLKK